MSNIYLDNRSLTLMPFCLDLIEIRRRSHQAYLIEFATITLVPRKVATMYRQQARGGEGRRVCRRGIIAAMLVQRLTPAPRRSCRAMPC